MAYKMDGKSQDKRCLAPNMSHEENVEISQDLKTMMTAWKIDEQLSVLQALTDKLNTLNVQSILPKNP